MPDIPHPTLEEAHEAQATLRACRSYLMDGEGNLKMTPEIIRSFTDLELDPRRGPVHGFLTPEAWMAAPDHAGFRELTRIPPTRPLMDRDPSFNVGAIVGVG